DALTGLPNRRSALRYLKQQIDSSAATQSPVSVLFLDLDGFKAVNDENGHHVGDELLVKVAVRLRRVVREHDRVCRLGGDEFVLICPGLDQRAATLVAHRVRTVMSTPFQIGDLEVVVGASVGVAASAADSSVSGLMATADAAMSLDKLGAARRRDLGRAVVKPSASIPWPAEPLPTVAASIASANDGSKLAAALTGLQARAEAAFAHSGDLVMFFALDGTVLSVSPATRAMFGIEPDELIGLNSLNLVHPDDQERVFLEVASIPNLGDSFRTEFRVVDRAGNTRWLEEIATNLIDDPNVGCFVGNMRDVTERVELLERIDADRQRLADAQASAKLGSFEMDTETGLIRRSDELWRMCGLPPGSQERDARAFSHPEDLPEISAVFAAVSAGEGPGECVHRIIRVDGEVRWVRTEMSRSGSSNSNVVTGTVLDITERHQAEEALAHQATHDWLTQLPNVASLHATLQADLSGAAIDQHVALALIDIDDFKLVNERNGHALGDAALQGFADRLVTGLPPGDLVARFDGDGFAVVRTSVSSHDDAKQLGDAIVSVLREPLTVGEHGVQVAVTASVGVALSTASDSSASLLRDADDALHHAKASGKNRVTVFDGAARSRAHRRRTLAASLPLALERDELHVEYQPIIDLVTLTTVGFEALLRWQHPDLGVIAPLEFIPLAEASGEILPIGDWVVEQAARQLAVWRADSRIPDNLWMAINVSATQLAQPLFADRVVAAVRRVDVPLAAIQLEITESVLVDRIDNALRTIEELRTAGFNVSIDDFGTGYSSLSYLSRMPVDTLKIDRSFVAGLMAPGPAASIIRTITALADTLDLDTVAEGIELPLQLERLKQLGCRYGQGFLWSPGLRADDAFAWMIEQTTCENLRTTI
ncbi:MAG TPA: diguanylate cyclase, partial [Ilumatobacter sp.]|nr:diguanylate cyclase [Ilumatobacter sp.]